MFICFYWLHCLCPKIRLLLISCVLAVSSSCVGRNYDIMASNVSPFAFPGQFPLCKESQNGICSLWSTTGGDGSLLLRDLLRDLFGSGRLHHLRHSRDQEQNLYGDQPDVRCQKQHPQRRADDQRSPQDGCDERLRNPEEWALVRRWTCVWRMVSWSDMTEETSVEVKGRTSAAKRRSAASCENCKDQSSHTSTHTKGNTGSSGSSSIVSFFNSSSPVQVQLSTVCETEVTRPCVSNQPSVTF